jgi:hypothetical protein
MAASTRLRTPRATAIADGAGDGGGGIPCGSGLTCSGTDICVSLNLCGGPVNCQDVPMVDSVRRDRR